MFVQIASCYCLYSITDLRLKSYWDGNEFQIVSIKYLFAHVSFNFAVPKLAPSIRVCTEIKYLLEALFGINFVMPGGEIDFFSASGRILHSKKLTGQCTLPNTSIIQILR